LYEELSVSAFDADMLNSLNLLATPLSSPVPTAACPVYNIDGMNSLALDRGLSHHVARWMDGDYGAGEEGLISRNDALFSIYHALAGLDPFSRNKSEDSTVAMTRSDRTDKYQGVTLVKVEENDDNFEEALSDITRKAVWLPHYNRLPFIFAIAVSNTRLGIYSLNKHNEAKQLFICANLADPVGRWDCVVAAINIARVFKRFI
jgi:hypothetical protein